MKDLAEFRRIWKSNTAQENICWIGSIAIFICLIPWILYQVFFGEK